MSAMLQEPISARKIRVLIVDDSKTICKLLAETFSEDPGLEVVGYALDPYEARDMIKNLKPDVITLDIEMPKMDGITFLKNLMRLNPMPVVMFSSLTDQGAVATFESLQAGAVDFMPKFSARSGLVLEDYVKELVVKVKTAAKAKAQKPMLIDASVPLPDMKALERKMAKGARASKTIKRIIMIGSSTGGPEALRHVVSQLPTEECAFVICQHMSPHFLDSFVQRLNTQTKATVSIANNGELIQAGHGYVAYGDQHLTIEKRADGFYWKVTSGEKVSGHKPSVDLLFKSAALQSAANCIGVLLTGMGDDGAAGLKAMRDAGSTTIIQDKETSVVWGMPGKAHALDAQDETLALRQIAPAIKHLCNKVL